MTCSRCEGLEERVAWLESELGIQRDLTDQHRIRKLIPQVHNRTRMQTSKVMLAMFRAKGRIMTAQQIMEAVPPKDGTDDERDPKIVSVWMHIIRQSLGKDAIETMPGHGYCLSKVGMARVAEALGEGA